MKKWMKRGLLLCMAIGMMMGMAMTVSAAAGDTTEKPTDATKIEKNIAYDVKSTNEWFYFETPKTGHYRLYSKNNNLFTAVRYKKNSDVLLEEMGNVEFDFYPAQSLDGQNFKDDVILLKDQTYYWNVNGGDLPAGFQIVIDYVGDDKTYVNVLDNSCNDMANIENDSDGNIAVFSMYDYESYYGGMILDVVTDDTYASLTDKFPKENILFKFTSIATWSDEEATIKEIKEDTKVNFWDQFVFAETAEVTGSITSEGSAYTATADETTFPIAKQWQRAASETGKYEDIAGATQDSYTARPDDVGKYLRVKITSTDYDGSVTLDAVKVETGKYDKPAQPSYTTTQTSIALKAVAGQEYSMDNKSWKTSGTFTGLTADTAYTVYARVAATTHCEASDSISFTVKTSPLPAPAKGKTKAVGSATYKVVKSATSGGTVTLKSVTKKTSSYKMPTTVTIDGYKFTVTGIDAKAFKNNKKLKSVTISSQVTTIGKEAFYGCSKLKTITIKSTKLKSVGKNAFKKIYKKATIKVPKKYLKKYTKLLKKKGQPSSVKIKKA